MKTILATIVSMFLFVSFANAQAKSCADLIKSYDAAVKRLHKEIQDEHWVQHKECEGGL